VIWRTPEAGSGLYRIEVTSGPGGGIRILNHPTPPPLRESVKIGEQNLYSRSKELVGDRDPREHEFSVQMRAMDADKSGEGLGLPVLVALCGALLGRNTRGGTIVVGALNLGSIPCIKPHPLGQPKQAGGHDEQSNRSRRTFRNPLIQPKHGMPGTCHNHLAALRQDSFRVAP